MCVSLIIFWRVRTRRAIRSSACSFAIRSQVTLAIIQRAASNTRSVMLRPHRSHRNLIHVTPRGKSRRTLFHCTRSRGSPCFSFPPLRLFSLPSYEAIITFALMSVSRLPARFAPNGCSSTFNWATIIVTRGCYMYTPYYVYIRISLFPTHLFIYS